MSEFEMLVMEFFLTFIAVFFAICWLEKKIEENKQRKEMMRRVIWPDWLKEGRRLTE